MDRAEKPTQKCKKVERFRNLSSVSFYFETLDSDHKLMTAERQRFWCKHICVYVNINLNDQHLLKFAYVLRAFTPPLSDVIFLSNGGSPPAAVDPKQILSVSSEN